MSLFLFLQIALTTIAVSVVLLFISMIRLTIAINKLNKATGDNLNKLGRVRRNGAV